jgi:hypothetical protein
LDVRQWDYVPKFSSISLSAETFIQLHRIPRYYNSVKNRERQQMEWFFGVERKFMSSLAVFSFSFFFICPHEAPDLSPDSAA